MFTLQPVFRLISRGSSFRIPPDPGDDFDFFFLLTFSRKKEELSDLISYFAGLYYIWKSLQIINSDMPTK